MSIPELKAGYYWKYYKFEIYPTNSQKEFIDRNIEIVRFVYNWALEQQNKHFHEYKEGKYKNKFFSLFQLQQEFTKFKSKQENSWLYEMPCESLRTGIQRLHNGIVIYTKTDCRFPKFKKKKNSLIGSYQVRNDRFYIKDGKIRIEGLPRFELIESKCPIDFSDVDVYYNTVLKRDSVGRYWISFSVQKRKIPQAIHFKNNAIGIDLNVKDRFVCSNGYRSGSPKIEKYKRLRSKLHSKFTKDLERRLEWERTNPDTPYVPSKNEIKRDKRYKRIHRKIYNVVETFIQTETKKIIQMNPSVVVMETMNNKSINSRHHVAKLTMEAKFYRCMEVMKYKCEKYEIPFILAPAGFPSTQLCNNCGSRYKVGTERIYKCPSCGLIIDRDLNAAINLKNLAFT